MPKRITIQLVGTEIDREDVRLDDFIGQLQDVKKALRENELAITGKEESTIDYKVVDLRHDSPATVVLEPIPTASAIIGRDHSLLISEVTSGFAAELRAIKKTGSLLRDPDLERLRAYQKLGTHEHNQISKLKIAVGRNTVTIDSVFQKKLDAIVGPDEFAEGSVSGMLEAVNFHNTNRFYLYPVIGPKHVFGTFREHLRPRVKEAIGNFVTVSGKLRYKTWSQFPHGIIAEDVDIHEPDSELPGLAELRGAFVGSLGDLDSVQFVDSLRED
ncbi:MAG: hypothetical protein WBQ09_18665 [Terriglobales bacterium]